LAAVPDALPGPVLGIQLVVVIVVVIMIVVGVGYCICAVQRDIRAGGEGDGAAEGRRLEAEEAVGGGAGCGASWGRV
jgi:hypothetical protein